MNRRAQRERPRSRAIAQLRTALAWAALTPGALLLLAAISPWRPWLIDMLAQAAWRGWMLSIVAVVVAVLLRRLAPAGVAALLAAGQLIINAAAVAPGADRTAHAEADASTPDVVRIGFANVGPPGRDPREALQWLLDADADVLAIVETGNYHLNLIPELTERYPHIVRQEPGRQWPRLVLSRHPFQRIGLHNADDPSLFSSFVTHRSITIEPAPGSALTIAVVHCVSPRTAATFEHGIAQAETAARTLAEWRSRTDLPVVVVGDMNSTPLGRLFAVFRRVSGLEPAPPRGLAGTWPASFPGPFAIPIDHAWLSDDLSVSALRVSPPFAGDHRAIVIDVALP